MTKVQMLNALGWAGSALLAVIVARMLWNGVSRRFRYFTAYLAFVLVSSTVGLWLYRSEPKVYPYFYWVSEVVAMALGLAVSSEVLRRAFESYPAIRGAGLWMMRIVLALILFRVVVSGHGGFASYWIELDRDTRLLQAVMLISIALLSLYYAIRLDRNLAGILGGYSLFICCSIINLALRTQLGASFQAAWEFLQPAQYVLCEAVWCATLWRASEAVAADVAASEPASESSSPSSAALALETRLARLRAQFRLGGI